MWSFRHVNTPYEVRNVPPFSSTDPYYVPSRWIFVAKRAAMSFACYIALDLLGARSPPSPSRAAELFDAARVPIFSRLGCVTGAELKLQALTIFGFAVTFYCIIQGGVSAASMFAVGSGLSNVESWRPSFGNLAEAYRIKNLWGYVPSMGK